MSKQINWMSRADFETAFKVPAEPLRLIELCNFNVSFETAEKLIPFAPLHDPPDSEYEPGPVADWYGIAGDQLFILMAHKSGSVSNVEVFIQPNQKAAHKYPWQNIGSLDGLPDTFLKSIFWVNSADGLHSFAIENQTWEKPYNVFFGATKEECIELRELLMAFGSRYTLEVKELKEPTRIP